MGDKCADLEIEKKDTEGGRQTLGQQIPCV